MINRVVLVGRLTRDPVVRKTASDASVASFTLAVDNRTRDAEGKLTASFIPVTVWNQGAEIVSKYAKQGTLLGVEGRLNQRSYKRNDGTNAQVIEVIADSITLLSPKDKNEPAAPVQPQQTEDSVSVDDLFNDDESPF